MRVGFIGLGRMGQAMAQRVLDAGHELAVYNRTADKAATLRAAGAMVADSIASVSQGREAVITMLADDHALEAVILGEGGVMEALAPGAIHIAMGTYGVDLIRKLTSLHAEAEQFLVAAPVLGRPDAAAAGQLGIVAAGDPAALARCRPLFEAIGKRIFEAGSEPVSATAIKITNNFVLGCAIQAMGEAFSVTRKYGVAPQVLYEVLTEGLFSAPVYKNYGKIIVDQDYDNVGFTSVLALKDANLMLAAADAARVPMPSAGLLHDRLLSAIAHGDGERDWAVIARAQARASGLE